MMAFKTNQARRSAQTQDQMQWFEMHYQSNDYSLCNILPRPFQPIVERRAVHAQPMSHSRMTSQMDPLHFISCQHFLAYVIKERLTLAQHGKATDVTSRKPRLSFKAHLRAHKVRSD